MAKVRIKNLDKVRQNIEITLDNFTKDKTMLNVIGKETADRIRFFAKKGTPLGSGSFPSLKASTVAQRRRLAAFNKTASVFSPGRSNLSFTGQLLDSIKHKINRDGDIVIGAQGKRKPIRTGPNSTQRNTPTNEEVAEFVSELGFEFIGIDQKGIERIKNIMIRFLTKSLRTAGLSED